MSLSTTDGSSGLPAFSGILSDFFAKRLCRTLVRISGFLFS